LKVTDDKYASSKLLSNAMLSMGYTVSFDEPSLVVTFASPSGAQWQTRADHIAYPFNSDEVRAYSINKNRAYDLAKSIGFSAPGTLFVTDQASDDELLGMLQTYKKLIVKPNDSSLAKGLTIDITDLAQLKQAITYAKKVSSSVLVQQQVKGEEVRFAVLDGKVKAALLRRTARVIGDGHSTVAELIKQENKEREDLDFGYIAYPQLTDAIIDRAFLESSDIPAVDEIVELNHSTMIRGGCSVYNIFEHVDKSYIKLVEDLVAKLGAGFIVVDIFCRDFTVPATADNYWLIEFNTAPVLKLFYGCRDGKHFDIVPLLADMVDNHLHGR
jgi:D-alanine-D-alanine ligase-like ATP-grasp enzyme